MPRERYCKVCGGWHDPEAWPHNCAPEQALRSSIPAPMVVCDTMDPVRSQLDGRMYTSKSALRRTYKDAGVIEVGNDPARHRKPAPLKPDREAIKASIQKAKARFDRGERVAPA